MDDKILGYSWMGISCVGNGSILVTTVIMKTSGAHEREIRVC
jgi:hypothetical protein